MSSQVPKWWKEGVCYQIWPASYKDSNGDGIGDIPGIIGTLDYLKDLGVDYIWVSPMYDSPLHDMGYDIRNYEDVHPRFGTLKDMETLIHETHARDMHIILDLVVNHTSDEHKWFLESKKSKDNEYSDWYIWRDPKIVNGERQPPNNWASVFGGSAWKYVPERDQYYFHVFLDSQPDLNWEIPAVRQGIYNSAIKFWLEKGLDGFRVDTFNLYSKDQSFPDTKIEEEGVEYAVPNPKHFINGPGMHPWLKEQRKEALDPYGEDIILIGEMGLTPIDEIIPYISPSSREVDMVFEMSVVSAGHDFFKPDETRDATLMEVKQGFQMAQSFISDYGAWSTVFLENHDNQRSIIRFGSKNPDFQPQSAKLLALMLGTLSGTLVLYQGQEIGMTGVPREWSREEWNDAFWLNRIKEVEQRYPGNKEKLEKAMNEFQLFGRDHSRTPVQWTSGENAGFSTSKPWIRVNDNYTKINIQDQLTDSDSVLSFWKRVLVFRKLHKDTLVYGSTTFWDLDNPNTMTFTKKGASGEHMLITLNFTEDAQPIHRPPEFSQQTAQLLFGTGPVKGEQLQAWEGRVYLLN